jgi:preprotein translocase subunit SecG
MATVILSIHLLLALGLIIVVLLQRSEGGGLGIGGGGGVMTGRGAATALAKVTWGLGTAFVVTSLVLTIVAARQSANDSVLDRVRLDPGLAPSAEVPVSPLGEGEDLLPPIAPSAPNPSPDLDGPAAPPPLE